MAHSTQPRILLLSAYDAGSHKRWREHLVASQPDFHWQVLALPPLSRTPCLLYMHENQFAYPDSGKQHFSAEPQMVNLSSAD